MMTAEMPRRIVTFHNESRLRGTTALSWMPMIFTTGDFSRFARMCRLDAEYALDEMQLENLIVHAGNIWQRIGMNDHTIGASGATSKRMDFIWMLPPQWISAPDFAIDALTHREVARQFLIDRWNRREAEKKTAIVKSGNRSVKMHLFRRITE
jgi:hypothetical protein